MQFPNLNEHAPTHNRAFETLPAQVDYHITLVYKILWVQDLTRGRGSSINLVINSYLISVSYSSKF